MSDIFNDVINALQCLDERLFKWFVNHQNKEKIDTSRLIAMAVIVVKLESVNL